MYSSNQQVIADYKQMMNRRYCQGWNTDLDLETNQYFRMAYLAVIRHINQHGYGFLSLSSEDYRFLIRKYLFKK
jgi:hypothetical protein